ncbi:MAG: mechanosensitive ion channel family protein [Dehalococcoidia bacterium]
MTVTTLLSASPGILQEAEDNAALLAVTVVLSAAALVATWRWARPAMRWVLRKLDDMIPGDLSGFVRPVARTWATLVSGLILTGGSISLAHYLGSDTAGITDGLGDFGFGIGEWVRDRVLKLFLIVASAFVGIRALRHIVPGAVQRYVATRAREDTLEEELSKRETTLAGVIIGGLRIFVLVVAVIMVLSEIGLDIAPVLATAGVVGIAIAFGAQSLIRDFLSGLFILLEDQYRIGDVVVINGHGGLVEDISLRRTVMRDLAFVIHIIPNGEVREVQNLTKEKSRMMIDIPVAYKEDLDHCIKVLNRVGEEMQRDPEWGAIITETVHVLRIDDFADSSINIRVIGQTLPIRQWDVAGEFRRRVKKAFDEEGIEIPFPHQTVYWGTDQPPFRRPQPARAPRQDQGLATGDGA